MKARRSSRVISVESLWRKSAHSGLGTSAAIPLRAVREAQDEARDVVFALVLGVTFAVAIRTERQVLVRHLSQFLSQRLALEAARLVHLDCLQYSQTVKGVLLELVQGNLLDWRRLIERQRRFFRGLDPAPDTRR